MFLKRLWRRVSISLRERGTAKLRYFSEGREDSLAMNQRQISLEVLRASNPFASIGNFNALQ
jgi:hypothetical protein